jgi:glycerol-3-phosphate dehydrogenase
MKKHPLSSIDAEYDVILVGGGIVGSGLFRDLCLQGVKVLLIDKKDFSSQTSSASSKMLHGGLRYLENFDFGLVKEALEEKNLWLKIAPHLSRSESFYLPVYKDSLRPLWMVKLGLFLYDFLSHFENQAHRVLGFEKTLKEIPWLKRDKLIGAGVYHDGVVNDHRLGLDLIFDGLDKSGSSEAVNYVSLEDFIFKNNDVECLLKDEIHGLQKFVKAKHLVFATGPFTDKLLLQMKAISWQPCLLPSKGVHLRLKPDKLPLKSALVMTPNDQRVIFVIPHHDHILVGTTETEADENFFDPKVTQKDIDYLLQNINEYFPNINMDQSDVLSSFAGIRPLVKDPNSTSRGKTSREHHVYRPHEKVTAIVGGKYTTFRSMVQETARRLSQNLGLTYNAGLSKIPLSPSSFYELIESQNFTPELIEYLLTKEKCRTLEDLLQRRLYLYTEAHWHSENLQQFKVKYQKLLNDFLE